MIKIEKSARLELYHGRKYPITREKTRMISPRINLKVIIFPTIFSESS
jgi:hypothetical protein